MHTNLSYREVMLHVSKVAQICRLQLVISIPSFIIIVSNVSIPRKSYILTVYGGHSV